MKENPLRKLQTIGQSIWLDYTRRDLIDSGELARLIAEDGVSGMTSNPTIFEKAIASGDYYDDDIQDYALHKRTPNAIYETLSRRDIQNAADAFRSTYDKSEAGDGYVSLEVNPHLAHDTKGTVVEARRLWRALDRPNVFIKVPATGEGVPAIQQLIREGINVNVTLLFGLPRYRAVANAYLTGLEARLKDGHSLKGVVSVASFFLSRIDSAIDPVLEQLVKQGGEDAKLARKLHGEVAIASAVTAYQFYRNVFESERFMLLAKHGALPQRLLWASTSVKNPAYPELKYVEALIGPQTINTVPIETLGAYRVCGQPESRLEMNVEHAAWVFETLPAAGVDLLQIAEKLEEDGVIKFNKAFDTLIAALKAKATRYRDAINQTEGEEYVKSH